MESRDRTPVLHETLNKFNIRARHAPTRLVIIPSKSGSQNIPELARVKERERERERERDRKQTSDSYPAKLIKIETSSLYLCLTQSTTLTGLKSSEFEINRSPRAELSPRGNSIHNPANSHEQLLHLPLLLRLLSITTITTYTARHPDTHACIYHRAIRCVNAID